LQRIKNKIYVKEADCISTISSSLIMFLVFLQETVANLSGHVTDAKGAYINGAIVTVKHEPTGFVTSTQTNNKGIFTLVNLKVGGPYTVKISNLGFKDQVYTDVNLGLFGIILK
jgi:hypothetical protein